jgi:hypothetical protein
MARRRLMTDSEEVGLYRDHAEAVKSLREKAKHSRPLPRRLLPSIHYQIGQKNAYGVIDKIGANLIEIGLKLLPKSIASSRWYGIEERIKGENGTPVTTVNVYRNQKPEYTAVREDGYNDRISLGTEEVVTVDLAVDNPLDAPLLVMALAGSYPRYEKTRKKLFELTSKFPLVENEDYKTYIERFSEDRWLIEKRED